MCVEREARGEREYKSRETDGTATAIKYKATNPFKDIYILLRLIPKVM
jgi:hypothetical protein